MALGQHPVADLEHLRVGVAAVDRDGDQVGGLERLAGDARRSISERTASSRSR